jgi:hypothetical protein
VFSVSLSNFAERFFRKCNSKVSLGRSNIQFHFRFRYCEKKYRKNSRPFPQKLPMSEQMDFQEDKTLASVNIVCENDKYWMDTMRYVLFNSYNNEISGEKLLCTLERNITPYISLLFLHRFTFFRCGLPHRKIIGSHFYYKFHQ